MKALFIDLDGTLTDVLKRQVEAIHDTATHFGLKISKKRIKQLCAGTVAYSNVLHELGLELTDELIDYRLWKSFKHE